MKNPSLLNVRAARRFGASPHCIKRLSSGGVVVALLCLTGALRAQNPPNSAVKKGNSRGLA